MPDIDEMRDPDGEIEPIDCVILDREEFNRFIEEASEEIGDPSQVTGLMVLPWRDGPVDKLPEMVVRWAPIQQCAVIEWLDREAGGVRARPVLIPLSSEKAWYDSDGRLTTFHAKKAGHGIYALSPSLNMPGFLHVFVVLHNVPEPPPWESRIILSTEMPR